MKRTNYKILLDKAKTQIRSQAAMIGHLNKKKNTVSKTIVFRNSNMLTTDEVQALREQGNDWYAKWQLAESKIEELTRDLNIAMAAKNHLVSALFYSK